MVGGDVAKHEASYVIREPTDHEGNHHRTQDPDTVLQGLHAAGLHGHAEHRLLPTDGADLVFLGSLLEHDHELVGNDGVEHRNDDHGKHEGDERVDLDDRLQRGSVHDGGADDGIRILILSINLPHGKDHGDGQEEGGNPDAADELLGAAAGHDALGFEGVADGHVALHAEAGDVERRGIGAGIPEEVVALADRSSKSPGMMDPDEVVELDGHAEEEDEEVGEGEAGQVVMHGALQVLQRLLAHQRVRRDGVPHGAHEKESQIDDGHHDFGVDIGVDVQILLVGSFGEQVGAVGSVGVEVLGASGHGRGRGVGVHSVAGPPRRGCSSEPPHAPTYRCPQRGNLARFNAARRRRLPLPGCCARVSV